MIMIIGLFVLAVAVGICVLAGLLIKWAIKKTCSIGIILLKLLLILPVVAIALVVLVFGLYLLIGGITFVLTF